MRGKLVGIGMIVTLVVATFAAAPAVAGENYKGFERGDALITVEELKGMMDANDPDLIVVAVAKPLVQYNKDGHIPGAIPVWRGDYAPEETYPYGGMMLDRADFQKFAREKLGVNNDSKVVLYDHKYDATRLWWAFYMYGKTDVRVLDGGFPAWAEAGYEVDHLGSAEPDGPGDFVAKAPKRCLMASMQDVMEARTNDETAIWDTRSEAEWTGEKLKKGAFAKGRIPWATFQEWKHFKTKVVEDAKPTAFKTADEIQKVIDKFGMDENKRNIFYCQSGVRTTTNMFALYLMGWDVCSFANYDGSWIEWSYYHKDKGDEFIVTD